MNLFVDFDVLNEHFGARRRPEGSARATVASCESYASRPAGRSSELYLRAGDFKDMPGKALYYGEVMRVAGEWLRPLVAAAGGRRVDVVYHTVDAPGSRKPDQYVMTQGEARIALVNRGQSEQLHGWANTSTFPANVTFLVADWFNLTHHANGCRHLRSFDGTHYGHVVNTEKARQLVRSLELLPR